jgi:hypothetical protein
VFLNDLSLLNQIPAGSGPVFQPLPALQSKQTHFLDLADVEPTPEGLAHFREQFASLPKKEKGCAAVVHSATGHVVGRILGCKPSLPNDEELSREAVAMRQCVRLWQLIDAGNTEELSRRIRWELDKEGTPFVQYHGGADVRPGQPVPAPVVIASASVYPERTSQMNAADLVTPALLYIQTVVNEHLEGRATPQLHRSPGQKDLAIYPVPKDVLGGIWLQFAGAVSGNKEYSRCEVCRAWYEVGATGRSRKDETRKSRKDRQYCSPRCKQEAFRRRKAKVLELHAKRMKAKLIAPQVGSTVGTVKGWIASQKEKETSNGKKKKGKG